MPRKRIPARYAGKITYFPLNIPNQSPPEICEKVNALPFLAYHVETISDGRKICITKPGGKSPFGRLKVNDFMVWIYDEAQNDRWRISHQEIYDDVVIKLKADPERGRKFIEIMLSVCRGAEPSDESIKQLLEPLDGLPGIMPELILKAYKWIWAQEDCNYPTAKGRWLSMDAILELLKDEETPKS